MASLTFTSGTIELRGLGEPPAITLPGDCRWDDRSACYRMPAASYASVVRALVRAEIPYEDDARAYTELPSGLRAHREPRPYQREALAAWTRARGQGVVVLPTGAGKTHVALMAAEAKRRSTLIVTPTLDLVRQWYDLVRASFDVPVGLVGGGEHDVRDITVTTYDSAWMHMEHMGSRFGLAVFDECHHLPGESYAFAARFCLAPFRLGLTATPERQDGRDRELAELVGPVVYRRDIVDLSGEFLADYDVERIAVDLAPDEREEYERERAVYREFIRKHQIRMGSRDGWGQFVRKAAQGREGQRAMDAYRRQRKLAFAARSKLDYVGMLLQRHRHDRIILFTEDNATAYEVSRRFLIPAITHQTKVSERSRYLAGLADGTFGALVTSRVLNEGVDVPEANVAVVISGSGSVREHVQRLGRVLRKKGGQAARDGTTSVGSDGGETPDDGTRAVLYELVTADTSEAYTSERRRDHVAYR